MDKIACVKKKIEETIEKSLLSEDLIHSRNTLMWLLKLNPDADEALKISALGHDIERAITKRKVRRKDYKSYDEFKAAHALNSARILAKIMEECKISNRLVDEVFSLVSHHETGNGRAAVLRDADTISFFHVNLPHYFARNSAEETKKRSLWGYEKLPDDLKEIVNDFYYEDRELESLFREIISSSRS